MNNSQIVFAFEFAIIYFAVVINCRCVEHLSYLIAV